MSNNTSPKTSHRSKWSRRKGAAAVEFAAFAPFLVALTLGSIEVSHGLNSSVTMYTALREGARAAGMDMSGITNTSIEQNIRGFLLASGLPGNSENLDITFTHVEADGDAGIAAGDEFNVANGDNYLRLCRISASVPYDEVSTLHFMYMGGKTLTAEYVFRMGRIRSE